MKKIGLIIILLLRGIMNYAHTLLLLTGLAFFCVVGFSYNSQIGFGVVGVVCVLLSVLLMKSGGEN